MAGRNAPDLSLAADGETLLCELERNNPMQVLPGTFRSAWGEGIPLYGQLWQVPIEIPPRPTRPTRQDTRALQIDISPLLRLHEEHREILGRRIRWTYRYCYFEMLARRGILTPTFWVQRDHWAAVRAAHSAMCGEAGEERQGRWSEHWTYLMSQDVTQRNTPDNWLSLVEFDQTIAAWPGLFVQECIYLRMLPVYIGVTADDFRRRMLSDMLSLIMPPPRDPADFAQRWQEVASRLGLPLRWPTHTAMLLDRRDEFIVQWVREGSSPSEIAQRLMDEGLYPIYETVDMDAEDTLRNAKSSVHQMLNELKDQGRIAESQIRRRPRGRPVHGS